MSDGFTTTFLVGRFCCFRIAAVAKIATWWPERDTVTDTPTHGPTHKAPPNGPTHLADVDGGVRQALGEVEDAVGGEGQVLAELQQQQVGSHVLELPGPERAAGAQVTPRPPDPGPDLQVSVLQAVQQVVDQLLVLPVEQSRVRAVLLGDAGTCRHLPASPPPRSGPSGAAAPPPAPPQTAAPSGAEDGRTGPAERPSSGSLRLPGQPQGAGQARGGRRPRRGGAAHREVDAYGVVLPVDAIDDVIEQASQGRLLQGHGRGQAAAHQRGPHLAHTVPVTGPGLGRAGVEHQQAVERALEEWVRPRLASLA